MTQIQISQPIQNNVFKITGFNVWLTRSTPGLVYNFDQPNDLPRLLNFLRENTTLTTKLLMLIREAEIVAEEPCSDHECGFTPRYYDIEIAFNDNNVTIRYSGGAVWHGYAIIDLRIPVAVVNNPCDGPIALDLLHDIILLALGFDPCYDHEWFKIISVTSSFCRHRMSPLVDP